MKNWVFVTVTKSTQFGLFQTSDIQHLVDSYRFLTLFLNIYWVTEPRGQVNTMILNIAGKYLQKSNSTTKKWHDKDVIIYIREHSSRAEVVDRFMSVGRHPVRAVVSWICYVTPDGFWWFIVKIKHSNTFCGTEFRGCGTS